VSGTLESRSGVTPQSATEVRRRLVAESLRVGNPAHQARELPAQADPLRECQIELEVDAIRPYEHNPRRQVNPRFAEIKASIQASGVRNPITVTRRPDEAHFIVEAGGNTRLLALQQLWQETGEARFRKLWVLFRPWRSESHVLISHLIENEQRGEMTFWDKANGIASLKTQLETEQGRMLSLRQLEAELQQAGITLSHTTLNYYRYTSERLHVLAEAVTDLTGLDVIRIQPRLNQIRRYALARASLTEDALYAEVLEPVFRQHAELFVQTRSFEPEALCRNCEAALALRLNEPVEQCRKGLDALARPEREMATQDPAGPEGQRREKGKSIDAAGASDAPPADSTTGPESPVESVELDAVNSVYREATAGVPGNMPLPVVPPAIGSDQPGVERRLLIAALERFARVAGIEDCLFPAPAAPWGYTVMALPEANEALMPVLKRRAWWLLALLCDGVDQNLLLTAADHAHALTSGTDMQGAGVVDRMGAPAIDMPFLLWLFDAADEAAAAFRQIMALLIAQRVSAPVAPGQGGRSPACVEYN
jgi:ParB family protein of integrating conjugative element (PFGI_1 class)